MTGYDETIRRIADGSLPLGMLDGCNILITGATGLIGSAFVDALMACPETDCHVFASGRNADRAMRRFARYSGDSRFQFVRHDITQPLECSTDFHYIIHAASNASPNFFADKPVEVIKANIEGLNNLITYGLGHGMRRLLFVSSGEVYGEGDGRVFTEDYSGYVDCTSPRSCYPSSKRAAETLCAAYAAEYGADIVIARPCHVYGPGFTESDNRVYAQFIRNVLRGEDIVLKSSGSQFRSWCYVADCVSALLHILLKGENGQAYNIADAQSDISIRQLAELVAGIAGRKVIMAAPTDADMRGGNPVTKSVFSTAKLEALGWQAATHIAEGMRLTIEKILAQESPVQG